MKFETIPLLSAVREELDDMQNQGNGKIVFPRSREERKSLSGRFFLHLLQELSVSREPD